MKDYDCYIIQISIAHQFCKPLQILSDDSEHYFLKTCFIEVAQDFTTLICQVEGRWEEA